MNPLKNMYIRIYPDFGLRQKSVPVDSFDSALSDLVNQMNEAMQEYHGIGLAAPQVGINRRIVVYQIGDLSRTLVNPSILDNSTDHVYHGEGCLSLPGEMYEVGRHFWVDLIGYDEYGKKMTIQARGLEARVIQHEIDHLNGILVCDYEQCQELRSESLA